MVKLYATVAAAVVALGLIATGAYIVGKSSLQPADPFAQCRQGQTGGADIGGPFTLVDKDGKTVTDAEVMTKPTLVYFGYTFCPDVCPMDMSRNAEAADILEEQGQDINLVFITIDPARDTAQAVGDFAANIHPRAIGLTGSDAQIAAAAKAYRVYFKKQEDGDPNYYLMDHSAFSYLMLPGSGFADFYKHGASAEEVAQGVGCFLDAAPRGN
ncbi:SCO family protein [Xinfangfangia pollutisoli]|uniref:SCO family protein n=1 Tax=Xinfangfangia pollutisoli TaxID=2865960 RepID=UPI001CD38D08|nr:SCO family protein [Xinfangfangia pollutisoli]